MLPWSGWSDSGNIYESVILICICKFKIQAKTLKVSSPLTTEGAVVPAPPSKPKQNGEAAGSSVQQTDEILNSILPPRWDTRVSFHQLNMCIDSYLINCTQIGYCVSKYVNCLNLKNKEFQVNQFCGFSVWLPLVKFCVPFVLWSFVYLLSCEPLCTFCLVKLRVPFVLWAFVYLLSLLLLKRIPLDT